MSQPRQSYRLNAEEFHELLVQVRKTVNGQPKSVKIEKSQHSVDQEVEYFVIEEANQRPIIVFNISKDAASKDNEFGRPFIGELLQKFLESNSDPNAILLMPLLQCRHVAKMKVFGETAKRQHIVLLEVDLKTRHMVGHDAQSYSRYILYPDKIKDISKSLKFQYQYHTYDIQKDHTLCGWFVHSFVKDFLTHKNSRNFNKVRLKESDYAGKQAYLNEQIPDRVEQQKQKEQIGDLDYPDSDDDLKPRK